MGKISCDPDVRNLDTDQGRGVPFGRYVLKERLGAGGMAEIFRAELPGPGGFSKPVVLKRLREEASREPALVRMFLDEASIAARFSHHALVQVFEVIEIAAQYGIAMEYVVGVDLATLIYFGRQLRARRLLSASQCLYIITQVADGLRYVHSLADQHDSQSDAHDER